MLKSFLARQAEGALRSRLEGFAPKPGEPFPAGAHPLDWRRSGLTPFGRLVCRSFTEALLCDEDERGELVPPDAATLDRVVHKMDLWLGTASTDLSRAFLALCFALEGSPTLTLKRARRFTSLPLRDRLHVLETLEDHPNGLLSMLLTAFKVPLGTAAFEQGELLADTGFNRPDLIAPRDLKRASAT